MKLANNEIHLWFTHDQEIRDPELVARYHRLLAPTESERWQRFFFDKHRHQYLVTRGLLRSVLSLYSEGTDPASWSFEENPHGKPAIADHQLSRPLHFNLSHTECMIVLAISRHEIGVDAEWLEREGDTVRLADRFFSPYEAEQLRVLKVEHQRRRFFDLWTLKEAYIKACGMGLAIPLDHFSYAISEGGDISISFAPERNDQPERWSFWLIQPDETHRVALAIKRRGTGRTHRLHMRQVIPLADIVDVEHSIVGRSANQDSPVHAEVAA